MNLYFCIASNVLGIFGDYVWAADKNEAERKFHFQHSVWPNTVTLERKTK
jgi:hypothetical protein